MEEQARWLRISSWCSHASGSANRAHLRWGRALQLAASVAIGRPVVSGLLPKLIFLTYVAHVS